MSGFFVLVFIIFLSLNLFTAGFFYYFFPSAFTKALLRLLPLAGTALLMARFAVHRRAESWFTELIINAGHMWLGIIFILFCVSIAALLLTVLSGLFKISAPQYIGRGGLIIMVVFTILAVWGGQIAPEIKNIKIISPDLPLEKLSVVQLSDTHLGAGVSLSRVKKMVDAVNALNPDLILVTGDFFEHGRNRRANADALKNLKAKYGVYGSLGNHEFYGGVSESADFYNAAGVKLLRQQSEIVSPGIAVSGADDFNSARISEKDFAGFLNALDPQNFNILMSHEPKYFDTAKDKVNLMLCGHTHNGQIWPFKYLVRTRYKHVYGLFKEGKTNYYVTSGVFYWGPALRLFSRNEIPFITIGRK